MKRESQNQLVLPDAPGLFWEAGREETSRDSELQSLSPASCPGPTANSGFSRAVTLPLSFLHGSKVQKQQNPWCV